MSGLTGYLLTNGTDLSYVFMPINAVLGVVTLSSNNIFTGTNKFSAGILGPIAGLTYTSDMIGYTIKKNGTATNFTVSTGTIYNVHTTLDTNGVLLSAGVWFVTLNANFQPSNTAGSYQFMTTGISTDGTTPSYIGGTGEMAGSGSASIPASANSRISGVTSITIVVPSGGATYYQLVSVTFITFNVTCLATTCFFNATRIA